MKHILDMAEKVAGVDIKAITNHRFHLPPRASMVAK